MSPKEGQQLRALVLGGKGGIGAAICTRLAEDNVSVTAVGRNEFDLTRKDEVDAWFDQKDHKYEILVHSAAQNDPKIFEQLTDEEIRANLEVNLLGFLNVVRRCLPYWRERRMGRIVVLSSVYGFLGRRGRLPYVMAKHALVGAVKTLCIELADYGVLVNAVSPGYIATQLTYKNNSPETIARFVSGIPVGRLGEPEDIAEVVAFLCSPRNRYLTGGDIVVDGGFTAGGFQN